MEQTGIRVTVGAYTSSDTPTPKRIERLPSTRGPFSRAGSGSRHRSFISSRRSRFGRPTLAWTRWNSRPSRGAVAPTATRCHRQSEPDRRPPFLKRRSYTTLSRSALPSLSDGVVSENADRGILPGWLGRAENSRIVVLFGEGRGRWREDAPTIDARLEWAWIA